MGTIYFIHGNATVGEMDDNNDTFLDRPKDQINATYWITMTLENSGFGLHFGIQYLVDKRIAGQVSW